MSAAPDRRASTRSGWQPTGSPAGPGTSIRCWSASATRASSCSARRRTARTSSTAIRAEITKRLIREKGFHRGRGRGRLARRLSRQPLRARARATSDATEALDGFRRFPQWMWRNADVLDFVGWLRASQRRPPGRDAQGRLLRARPLQPARVDGRGARVSATWSIRTRPRARRAPLRLLRPVRRGSAGLRLRRRARPGSVVRARGGRAARRAAAARRRVRSSATAASHADELFFAEQNARVVRDAERYYRAMFGGRVSSWNLRDQHMAETLECAGRRSSTDRRHRAKIVVWAHNSHSATRRRPRWASAASSTSGQLVRERYGTRRRCWSASPRYARHGHRRVRLGRARRAEAGAPRAAPGATRRCSTTRRSATSILDLGAERRGERAATSRASSARSA